ncbi:MAG: hypothetical protein SF051_01235 [Elusimicrobiota bacterium]|nr:hypothetical protein [Elusimicrobiota bacterium]
MRLLLVLCLLPMDAVAAPATRAGATGAAAAARPVPGVIVMAGLTATGSLLTPTPAPSLILPERGRLIIPASPKIVTEAPSLIVPAARSLTEAEAAADKPVSGEELRRLADSLAGGDAQAPQAAAGDEGAGDAALAKTFDGASARDGRRDGAAAVVAAYFAAPAEGPALDRVAAAATVAYGRLLRRLDRPVKTAVVFDRSRTPSTGHLWSKEGGHRIEILPEPADGRGEVASAFGLDGQTRVQRKVERFMLVGHERAHAVFDDAVGRRGDHPMDSAYAAMTEGFAVTAERLLIDRLLADPFAWGLGPRDAADLLAIHRAREQWLSAVDTHYSEGFLPWSRALASGGEDGVLAFLARLSASRMAEVPRADPAYQLASGDPELLAAYLGRDPSHPLRRGLEAYAKAAAGEELTPAEAEAAASVIERAGPEGRARVFDRTLRVDRALPERGAVSAPGGRWWESPGASLPDLRRAFAVAALSPAGAAELAAYLAERASRGELDRVMGSRGPGARLDELVKGAETLPFDEAGRKSWLDGLMDWLTRRV